MISIIFSFFFFSNVFKANLFVFSNKIERQNWIKIGKKFHSLDIDERTSINWTFIVVAIYTRNIPLHHSAFLFFPLSLSLSLSLHDPLPLSNRTDISRKFLTRVLRKTVSAFPCFDFARKAMEREWRVRGGQILSRGLTAGYGLKGVKCYYCKGYVCGREY